MQCMREKELSKTARFLSKTTVRMDLLSPDMWDVVRRADLVNREKYQEVLLSLRCLLGIWRDVEIKQLKVQSEDIHVNIICADRGYPKLSLMKEGLNGMAIPAKEKKGATREVGGNLLANIMFWIRIKKGIKKVGVINSVKCGWEVE